MGQGASSITCASSKDYSHSNDDEDQQQQQQQQQQQEEEEEEEEQQMQEGLSVASPPEDYTTLLPDECLMFIFQKVPAPDLNQCSLACTRWHAIESRSRHRLSLRAHAEIVPSLPSILARFDTITKLILRCDRKTPSITDKALVIVGRQCAHLRKLKIKGCRQLTDSGLDLFAPLAAPTLQKLSLGTCGFGAWGINSIVTHCTLLEDLTVKRLRGLLEGPAEFIRPGNGSIRRLCLKELFNAQLFAPLMAGSKSLHTLMICRNSGNWDSLLECMIADRVPSLVELHMERIHLSDRGLHAVSRCTNLEVLYVAKVPDCTNRGLSVVAEGCKRLRKLHLDGWKSNRIGDDGLIALGLNCRDLQEVVLIGINVTTSSLNVMASNCLNLERLALCNSETVGDSELSFIAVKCRSLKRLCMKGCAISDQGMRVLVSGCPQLVKLKVKKCRGVTWESAVWLRVHRPPLIVCLDCKDPNIVDSNVNVVGLTDGIGETNPVALPPLCLHTRSAFSKVKFSLVASGSFLVCGLLRWSSSKGSKRLAI